MRKYFYLFFLFITCTYAQSPVSAKHAMVVTEQMLATQVGIDILKQGGNAIDAAVAVGYALAVVNPASGNIGGGGFMTIHFANGKNVFINFREKAPLKSTKDMYLDKNKKIIPGNSTYGYLAVGVPGTVLGLDTALKKYGKLSRQNVMLPAIMLAEKGFKLSPGDIEVYAKNIKYFSQSPNVATIFLKDGKPFQAGELFVQKNLANTLKLISQQGAKVFYQGTIAKQIVTASNAQGGILSLNDFAHYNIEETTPLTCHYHQYVLLTAPLPGSGITLCESLAILEGYPLKKFGFHSQDAIHYMIEAMRFSFADRNTYLGDANFIKFNINNLLNKNYIATIRKHISAQVATPSNILPLARPEGMHTTHYSILDKDGNAVSVTYTLNGFYGAKVIAGNTGFFLNNEMDDFTEALDQVNQFGLHQGSANRIEPAKRPLSSMVPTIILENNKVVMVVGSPGGPRIITSVLQTIINTLDFKMNIQEAVDAKRFHQQWLPDIVYVEPNAISDKIKFALQNNGYKFETNPPWSVVEAIYVNPQTHKIYGGSDDRRLAGKAIGY